MPNVIFNKVFIIKGTPDLKKSHLIYGSVVHWTLSEQSPNPTYEEIFAWLRGYIKGAEDFGDDALVGFAWDKDPAKVLSMAAKDSGMDADRLDIEAYELNIDGDIRYLIIYQKA